MLAARGGVALLVGLLAACEPSEVPSGPTTRPTFASAFLQQPTAEQPKDLPDLEFELPPEARVIDTSAAELADALRRSGGRAFVILKNAAGSYARSQRRFTPDQMSVGRIVPRGIRSAISARAVDAALAEVEARGGRIVNYYAALGIARVLVDPARTADLLSNPWIDSVDPEIGTMDIAAMPITSHSNAAWFAQQTPWGIDSTRAPAAWPLGVVGLGSKVLIADQGHFQGHEDLPFVANSHCFGVFGGCNDDPVVSHGTHVMGIAGAVSNALGVVGMAPGITGNGFWVWGVCDEVPLNAGGQGCTYAEQFNMLNWAVTNLTPRGVINMSYSGIGFHPTVALGIAAAGAAGIVMVAAVGNEGTNVLRYPAAYAEVIGVAGIRQNLTFPFLDNTPCSNAFDAGPGSSFGSDVDFVAAWDALSTIAGNQYAGPAAGWCGTSMATPHVTGLVALLRGQDPNLSTSGVYSKMKLTAKDLGPAGWDEKYGFGLIRANLAVGLTPPAIVATTLSQKPRLTWNAIPFATEYRIYRRVTPTLAPNWALWATKTTTSYTDTQTPVSSFYGYNSYPAGQTIGVSYYVVAFADGVESGYGQYATYIPIGTPPF